MRNAMNMIETVTLDQGLQSYMLRIYNYMAAALVVTGAVAFYAAHSELMLRAMYTMQDHVITGTTPLAWIIMFAPLGLIFFLGFRLQSLSLGAVQITYWSYAALIGLSLSTIFLAYTDSSIAQIFFITAVTFSLMSVIGYTTKKNLTGLGTFLMMGLIGLIIASLVNLFLRSDGMQFVLSVIGVLAFTGLTAFDAQKLKNMYISGLNDDSAAKSAIMGALTLYLDFINIFLSLLQLMGKRRDR